MYLPKSHFISQDTIDALFVQGCQPIQALKLVFLQLCHEHLGLPYREVVAQRSGVLEVELVRVN